MIKQNLKKKNPKIQASNRENKVVRDLNLSVRAYILSKNYGGLNLAIKRSIIRSSLVRLQVILDGVNRHYAPYS